MEAAASAGVPSATLDAASSTAKVRAAADLTLLSEVAALAATCMTSLSAQFRSGIYEASAHEHAETLSRITTAMKSAERAGLPASEIDAARGALHMHLQMSI